jgi:HD-like signal output (HDOD) protein
VNIDHPLLESFQARVSAIPPLPAVIVRLLHLLDNPSSHLTEISQLIRRDGGISSMLLRQNLGALHAVSPKTNNIEEAIQVLGFNQIRTMVWGLSAIRLLNEIDSLVNARSFWLHSAISAAACRSIARFHRTTTPRQPCGDPDLAYLIGLLKGSGKVVWAAHAPESYRRIIQSAEEQTVDFHTVASSLHGFHEGAIASALLRHWKFDDVLCQAVADQHAGAQASVPAMAIMCELASELTTLQRVRSPGDCGQFRFDKHSWAAIGGDATVFSAVHAELTTERIFSEALLDSCGVKRSK